MFTNKPNLLPRQNKQKTQTTNMAAACIRNCRFLKPVFSEITSCRSNILIKNSYFSTNKSFKQNHVGIIAVGLAGGALVGGGLSWYKFQEVKAPVLNNAVGQKPKIIAELPNVRIARTVNSPTDSTNLHLILFQYPTCPFCCKVRAFLDFYGFSYEVVEVDPVLRNEMKWTDYKKVPVLLAKVEGGYQQLNDSTMIVSALKSFLHDRNSSLTDVVKCYPTMSFRDDDGYLKTEIMNRYFLMHHDDIPKGQQNKEVIEERKWRKWADDSLVHMLSPNVYRTKKEALESFEWFSEVGEWDRLFPSWERNLIVYVGASAMWMLGKRLKARHGLKDDVRQSLYDDCNQWMREIKKKGTRFLGGSTPNLADLAVYGVLTSIEGCQAFSDLKANTRIGDWYYPMKEAVSQHIGCQEIVR